MTEAYHAEGDFADAVGCSEDAECAAAVPFLSSADRTQEEEDIHDDEELVHDRPRAFTALAQEEQPDERPTAFTAPAQFSASTASAADFGGAAPDSASSTDIVFSTSSSSSSAWTPIAPSATTEAEDSAGTSSDTAAAATTATAPFAVPRSSATATARETVSGRLVFQMLRARGPNGVEGFRGPRARRLVTQLRQHIIMGFVCSTLGIAAVAWLFARGTNALASAQGDNCKGPLRDWLMSYLLLQVIGPICMPLAVGVRRLCPYLGRVLLQIVGPGSAIILLGWCIAAVAYVRAPDSCPSLLGVPSEALAVQSLSVLLLIAASTSLLSAQPIIGRLDDILARSSSASEHAALIAVVPDDDVPPPDECPICLGCYEEEDPEDGGPIDAPISVCKPISAAASTGRVGEFDNSPGGCEAGEAGGAETTEESDGTDGAVYWKQRRTLRNGPRWRQLDCGHRFHETCLFEWLRKAKRCPLCRGLVSRGARRHPDGRGGASPSLIAPVSGVAAARSGFAARRGVSFSISATPILTIAADALAGYTGSTSVNAPAAVG